MSDPFDYRDPAGLDLELDLPSAPPPRAAAKPRASAHTEDFAELPEAFQELPEELTAPFVEAATEQPESTAWSLELEDIAPPVATPSLASAPRAAAAVRVAAQLQLPQPSVPQHAPPVRTLELRIAQSVDRMSPMTRVGLLTLTVVAMLLLATSVLMAGVRSALHTLEQVQRAAQEAQAAEATRGGPRVGGGVGAYQARPPGVGGGADPYERYRVDDVLQVDDDGRHVPRP